MTQPTAETSMAKKKFCAVRLSSKTHIFFEEKNLIRHLLDRKQNWQRFFQNLFAIKYNIT